MNPRCGSRGRRVAAVAVPVNSAIHLRQAECIIIIII